MLHRRDHRHIDALVEILARGGDALVAAARGDHNRIWCERTLHTIHTQRTTQPHGDLVDQRAFRAVLQQQQRGMDTQAGNFLLLCVIIGNEGWGDGGGSRHLNKPVGENGRRRLAEKRLEMLRAASHLLGLMMNTNYTASPVGQPLITEDRVSCCLGLAC